MHSKPISIPTRLHLTPIPIPILILLMTASCQFMACISTPQNTLPTPGKPQSSTSDPNDGWGDYTRLYRNKKGQIIELNLGGKNMTDRLFQKIKTLPYLKTLSLDGTLITNDLLKKVARLKPLRRLNMRDPYLNTLDLSILDNSPIHTINLAAINFAKEKITWFKNPTSLKSLYLFRTKGIKHIAPKIANTKSLTSISLAYSDVSDSDVKKIVTHPGLFYLDLQTTSVSDDALGSIASSNSLKMLIVSDCFVTRKGVNTLRKHSPHLDIYSDRN